MKLHFSLTVFIIFLFNSASYSQLRIHVGSGINVSKLNSSDASFEFFKSKSAVNYFISVRPELGLSEKWAVSTDLQFSQKGYLATSQIADVAGYRFQFLDLIPQIEYKMIPQAAIYGGVGIGIRLNEKNKINDIWKESYGKLANNVDPTYVIGARFIPMHRLSVQVQFASTLGDFIDLEFTDAFGNPAPNISNSLSNIQIGITYQVF